MLVEATSSGALLQAKETLKADRICRLKWDSLSGEVLQGGSFKLNKLISMSSLMQVNDDDRLGVRVLTSLIEVQGG